MTAVQKIIEQIDEEVQVLSNLYGSEIKGRLIALAFAKKRCLEVLELEKQQIIDAHGDEQSHLQDDGSWRTVTSEQYYNETYGSKGSDEVTNCDIKTEISDEEIEKGAFNYAEVYQCPTEIKMCKHDVISAWNKAIKWYREQLKQRQ